MTTTELDLRAVEQFVYREARLCDEHDYDAWEALWTEDARYWVPVDGDHTDPERHVSIIYDNRSRIATRLKQLRTGKRWAASPPSNLRRLVTNVEILGEQNGDTVVGANFLVVESRERGVEQWGGRYTYRLRVIDGAIRLAAKKAVLVNSADVVPTLSFLI
jgi:benzoate/toluate 1,2-dioxygenase beta subunit